MRKRLIKGSKEAKLFMAKIRAKKSPAKKAAKKIGSVAESKKIKKELAAKKVRLVHGYETVKRKRKVSGIHKDTKSHNVKISVMSGIKELKELDLLQKNLKTHELGLENTKNILKNTNSLLEKKYMSNAIKFYKDKIKIINSRIKQQKILVKKHI